MVSETNSINSQEAPPPLDEAWWASLLAEDEVKRPSQTTKPSVEPEEANESQDQPQSKVVASTTDWEKAYQVYDKDEVITLRVSGYNRGGLLVCGDGIQGFVPISHLVEMPCESDESNSELEKYADQMLRLKVIECDQERGRVVFSERAALAEPGSRRNLLESLKPGNCITGTITNITDFGVFVDLGGVEGLVHVSELSWGRVHHPTDVVKLGQEVKVYVIHIDQERARVALSLKRLHPNPWESARTRYHPGQITEAVVTSIVPFGAFARLEEGLDGLIHISEMSSGAPPNPRTILQEGQKIQVRVLHVDAARQRLGLSLDLNDQ